MVGREAGKLSARNQTRLTPRQRLTRGLAYTAVGPVDVTRGILGLSLHSAQAGVSNLRRHYQGGRLTRDLQTAQEALAQELAAAQDVVTGLPQVFQQAQQSQDRNKRPWIFAGLAVMALAGGAVAFSIVRRSSQPEPSPRPPSVEVQPHP
jgi:Cell wall synthesis protein CwsA